MDNVSSAASDIINTASTPASRWKPTRDRLVPPETGPLTGWKSRSNGCCSIHTQSTQQSHAIKSSESYHSFFLHTYNIKYNQIWLPVQQRINYKVALLTFKVRSTSTPSYLHRLLQDREDVHNLRRRSATPALCRPFTKTTMAKRAFRCTAPAIWNSLPETVLDSDTVTCFKSRLKTHLFSQAFSHTPTDH